MSMVDLAKEPVACDDEYGMSGHGQGLSSLTRREIGLGIGTYR